MNTRKERFALHKLRHGFSFARTLILALMVSCAVALILATRSQAANTDAFFLVASRNMPDPVFQQTVILVLPVNEPPLVAGVIINKPTDAVLGKLVQQPLAPAVRNEKVYFGGPVDLTTPLLVLRGSRPPKAALQLQANVYAVDDPDSISNVLKSSRSLDDARLFLGRAQWAQEQLRGELLEGAWTVVPVRTDLIFEHDSAKVWSILSQHEHVREVDFRSCDASDLMTTPMCGSVFRR